MVAHQTSESSASELEFGTNFRSWPLSRSADDQLPFSLRHCAMLQDCSGDFGVLDESDFAGTPLRIRVRRSRVLLFASAFFAALLTLVTIFTVGVPLASFEGDWRDDEQRHKFVAAYNFYSGMTASAVAKPFEVGVDMVLPVLFLVFATKRCLGDDSLKWKLFLLACQLTLVTMLTGAFSSLYVHERQPEISPIVVDADLLSPNTTTASDSRQEADADPFRRRATTDTILSTAIRSAYIKREKNPCAVNGEWQQVTVTHSFSLNPWLKDMLPHGVAPAASLQMTVGEVVDGHGSSGRLRANQSLPFEMMTATNLLLHLMLTSESILPWISAAGMTNSTYDKFLWNATALNASNDETGFLYAAALMINKSLFSQARTLNYSAAEATLNFSHFEFQGGIVFDAVTVDIPFQEKLMTRKLRRDSGDGATTTSDNETAVYEVSAAYECGVDACLVEDPVWKDSDIANSRRWRSAPQIQAFASCDFGSGSEDVTVEYLHGRDCAGTLKSSMLIYSVGRRIAADTMELGSTTAALESRVGNLTNIRRFQTVTMGRLSWKLQNLADTFHAACKAEHSDCLGLSYQLDGNSSRHLVVGEKHLPLTTLGPFMGRRSQWTPLVMLLSSAQGDLLFKRNIRRKVAWEMDSACSDSIETLARQVDNNHWYMEFGVQEAYTSALFFLFQNAALREARQRVDGQRTLDFVGSRVEFTLEARIPLQAALISVCGSFLLLLATVLAVIIGEQKENKIRSCLDAQSVAKVLLVEHSFPKLFLDCTLEDPTRRATTPLEHFRIQTLGLKPRRDIHGFDPSSESMPSVVV